jgi:hypothetical protein
LSEVYHHASDEKSYEVLKMEQPSGNGIDDTNNDLSLAIEEERAEREPHVSVRRPLDPLLAETTGMYPKSTPETRYTIR